MLASDLRPGLVLKFEYNGFNLVRVNEIWVGTITCTVIRCDGDRSREGKQVVDLIEDINWNAVEISEPHRVEAILKNYE